MKIGVGIPVYKGDIIFINRCLRSIERQTRKPDVVAISASQCKSSDINIHQYSFPVRVQYTTEKQFAGKNRNIAGEMLSDMDIICFMDADDEMIQTKLEYTERAFTEYNIDYLLHYFKEFRNYKDALNYVSQLVEQTELEPYKCIPDCFLPYEGERSIKYKYGTGEIANGILSLRQHVFKIHKYKYDKYHNVGEDVEYNNRICREYPGGYIPCQLMIYHNYKENVDDLQLFNSLECQYNL